MADELIRGLERATLSGDREALERLKATWVRFGGATEARLVNEVINSRDIVAADKLFTLPRISTLPDSEHTTYTIICSDHIRIRPAEFDCITFCTYVSFFSGYVNCYRSGSVLCLMPIKGEVGPNIPDLIVEATWIVTSMTGTWTWH